MHWYEVYIEKNPIKMDWLDYIGKVEFYVPNYASKYKLAMLIPLRDSRNGNCMGPHMSKACR